MVENQTERVLRYHTTKDQEDLKESQSPHIHSAYKNFREQNVRVVSVKKYKKPKYKQINPQCV